MSAEERQHITRALAWLVGALRRHAVPYQVVGGLAARARAYGAHRPLADIDIYVPFERATGLCKEIRPFVTWGPERYSDEIWDLVFLKADYYGQRIEVGDSSTSPRFFDKRNDRWEEQRIHYARSTTVAVLGVEVAVMPREELIRYKSSLGREVDLVDVEQILVTSFSGGAER